MKVDVLKCRFLLGGQGFCLVATVRLPLGIVIHNVRLSRTDAAGFRAHLPGGNQIVFQDPESAKAFGVTVAKAVSTSHPDLFAALSPRSDRLPTGAAR